mmetsp:Transcript_3992/g.11351  ORF Transcript_3992/g.11351 Transcript_3992/m.11351 type:complete len:168 (-) Transcript_3992:1922-2425(-)
MDVNQTAKNMRLRTIATFTILLSATTQNVAFKQLRPRPEVLTPDAQKAMGARVNGAAASGFLRPDDMRTTSLEVEMQTNDKAEDHLKEREEEIDQIAWVRFMYFCVYVCIWSLLIPLLTWSILALVEGGIAKHIIVAMVVLGVPGTIILVMTVVGTLVFACNCQPLK